MNEGDAGFRLIGSDYVLISGCLTTELSNETTFNERRHGVMTWFLSQALQAADDTSTYRSIMDEVSAEVTNRYPSQHPQLEGPGTDLRVFGASRINPTPYVLVESTEAGTLKLGGGKVYGLGKASLLKVYAPQTVDFAQAQPVATIELTQVDDFSSRAVITDGGPVVPSSKAVLEALTYGDSSVPVYVHKTTHPSLEAIAKALESYKVITQPENEADARLIIDLDADTITINSGDLEVLVPPISLSETGHIERVVKQVRDVVHWLTVMALKSPSQAIKIDFEIGRTEDSEGEAKVTEIPPETQLSYRVRNGGEVPLFVYVLDVSSDGSIALLYPRVGGSQEALPPNNTLEQTIETYLPQGQERVVDVLKVIATTRPIDPSVYPQGALRQASPLPVTRGSPDPLAEFLSLSVRGKNRGAKPVEVKSWVTKQKSITIRRQGVRFSGFTMHFDATRTASTLPTSFGALRSTCSDLKGSAACFKRVRASQDGSVWDLIQRKSTRDAAETIKSVGRVFDEAYQIQEQTLGTLRVEPLLDVEVPGVIDQRGIDKRGLASDSKHDKFASNDDEWHLRQISAPEAWRKIRTKYGLAAGTEADGIFIAHIDTGYRDHPETWAEIDGKRPIEPSKGHDYYDNDDDPLDPLLDNRVLPAAMRAPATSKFYDVKSGDF